MQSSQHHSNLLDIHGRKLLLRRDGVLSGGFSPTIHQE